MPIVIGSPTDFASNADCRYIAPSVTETGDFAILAFTLESFAGDGAVTLPAVSGYIARVSVQPYSNYSDEFTTEYDNATAFTASLSDADGSAFGYSVAAAGDSNILDTAAAVLNEPWLGDLIFTLTSSIDAGSRLRVAVFVTSSPPNAQRLATMTGSAADIIAEEGKVRALEPVVTNAGHLTTLAFTAEDIGGADGTIALPSIVGHVTRLACIRHSDYSDEFTTTLDSAVDLTIELSDGHGNTYTIENIAKEGEANILVPGGIGDAWFGALYVKLTGITTGARVRIVVYVSQGATVRDVPTVGRSDYGTSADALAIIGSAGVIDGGELTDGGSQTIDYAACNFAIRISDDHTAPLFFGKIAAGSTAALTDAKVSYIGIEYNAGDPQVFVVEDTKVWNYHDEFPLGNVVREGADLHIENNPVQSANTASHTQQRFYYTQPMHRADKLGGLILGESADTNRYVTLSAGEIYDRDNEFVISAIDTSGADTFDIYYRDAGSGFTVDAGRSTWPNAQYDDGSGTLFTMTNNKYAVIWFYIELDGNLVAQYGRGEYPNAAAAENEPLPGTASLRVTKQSTPVGRIIFKKSADTATAVETVFETTFASAGVTVHADLSGLTADDHTQYALLDGTRAFTGPVSFLDEGNFAGLLEACASLAVTGEMSITGGISTPGVGALVLDDNVDVHGDVAGVNLDFSGTGEFNGSLFVGVPGAGGNLVGFFSNDLINYMLWDSDIATCELVGAGTHLIVGGTLDVTGLTSGVNLDFSGTGEFGGLLTAESGIQSDDDITLKSGTDFISNDVAGQIKLEGKHTNSGPYDEYLLVDFTWTKNGPRIQGKSSFTSVPFIYLDSRVLFFDNREFMFGNSGDARFHWVTTGSDFFGLGLILGGAGDTVQSGFLSIYDEASGFLPNWTSAHTAYTDNPTLRIYASSTTIANHVQFYHDRTDGHVESGAGDLFLNTPGNVKFGTYGAQGDTATSGYVTIRDAGGTLRKLAVIA